MPRYAANLTMLWPDLDVYDKFRAAAEAGFRRVEILFVHALDPARVERELREHRLELVLFHPAPGDWAKGERGLLSVPDREQEFLATVRDAIVAAGQIGDVPGRNQRGTGKQPIREFLAELGEHGYGGSVGLEYRPRGTMDEALGWLPRADRA